MDYETLPMSRQNIRSLSKNFRGIFGVGEDGPFPVVEVLDSLCDVFEGCVYEVVDDDELPPNTMARCVSNDSRGYTIEIRQSVYDGARRDGTGAFLGFICHELCHIFLFFTGFTPIMNGLFEDGDIPAYQSVEWQAKALCGEVMIPFDESKGMDEAEIIETYHVSKASAGYRCRQSQ